MYRIRKSMAVIFTLVLTLVLIEFAPPLQAQSLEAGTIVTADNLSKVKDQSFEGHSVSSLLPSSLSHLVKKRGLRLRISHTEIHPGRRVSSAKDHSARLNENLLLRDYKAGLPFPNLSSNDSNAGVKVYYNNLLGYPHGTYQRFPNLSYFYVDQKTGIKGYQRWDVETLHYAGTPAAEDGKKSRVLFKRVARAQAPGSLSGFGTVRVRYLSDRPDRIWNLLPSTNETVLIQDGAHAPWEDPSLGVTQLLEEIDVMTHHPSWYRDWTLVGKKTILAPMSSRWPTATASVPGTKEITRQFPGLELSQKPHWNPDPRYVNWEPREVWVVEAVLPEAVAGQRKVFYCDRRTYACFLSETYEEGGDLWKVAFTPQRQIAGRGKTDRFYWVSSMGVKINLNARSARIFALTRKTEVGPVPAGIDPDSFGLSTLKSRVDIGKDPS